MCGIPTDEEPSVTKPIGNESAADPVLLGNDLISKVGSHAEDRTNGPIAIDRIRLGLAVA
jgi:hypothetical protein